MRPRAQDENELTALLGAFPYSPRPTHTSSTSQQMNVVKEIQRINARELQMGTTLDSAMKGSWHDQYKDSAYIFIGGLSFELTEGDIVCVFSQYGEIVDVNLVRDKATGKSKGFAFVAYEDQRSTILAVDNFNGAKVLGRMLRVDHVAKYKPKKEDDKDAKKGSDGKRSKDEFERLKEEWQHDMHQPDQRAPKRQRSTERSPDAKRAPAAAPDHRQDKDTRAAPRVDRDHHDSRRDDHRRAEDKREHRRDERHDHRKDESNDDRGDKRSDLRNYDKREHRTYEKR